MNDFQYLILGWPTLPLSLQLYVKIAFLALNNIFKQYIEVHVQCVKYLLTKPPIYLHV